MIVSVWQFEAGVNQVSLNVEPFVERADRDRCVYEASVRKLTGYSAGDRPIVLAKVSTRLQGSVTVLLYHKLSRYQVPVVRVK